MRHKYIDPRTQLPVNCDDRAPTFPIITTRCNACGFIAVATTPAHVGAALAEHLLAHEAFAIGQPKV